MVMRLPLPAALAAAALSLAACGDSTPSQAAAENARSAAGTASATPSKQTPAALRAERLTEAFLAPDGSNAFVFEAGIEVKGRPMGDLNLRAIPDTYDGRVAWRAEEEGTFAAADATTSQGRRSFVWLAADLRLLRQEGTESKTGEESNTSLVRPSKTGLEILRTAHGVEQTRVLDANPRTTTSLVALVLFLRQCPREPATYELPFFDGSRDAVGTAAVEVLAPGRFTHGAASYDAFRAVAKLPTDNTLEIYLAPEDRSPIAIRQSQQGVVILKKSLAVEARPEPSFDPLAPATSALDAGRKFVFGLLTGDAAYASGTLDLDEWRTRAIARGLKATPEEFKARFLDWLKPSMKHLSPVEARAALPDLLRGAREDEGSGGDVRVALSDAVGRLHYTARDGGGQWRIVDVDLSGGR